LGGLPGPRLATIFAFLAFAFLRPFRRRLLGWLLGGPKVSRAARFKRTDTFFRMNWRPILVAISSMSFTVAARFWGAGAFDLAIHSSLSVVREGLSKSAIDIYTLYIQNVKQRDPDSISIPIF
jgi:hypothetical protein